jgi:lysophospholipase L1-like esterase
VVPVLVRSLPVRVVAAASTLLALVAGCSPPVDPTETSTGQYLAIGDSYSAGFGPTIDGGPAGNTTDGFAWRVAEATGLDLVNVSCSGITTVDFVEGPACPEGMRGDDGPDGPVGPVGSEASRVLDHVDGPVGPVGSEASRVLDHVDRHAGDIELVTVVLGVNDLRACTSFDARWRACVDRVLPRVRAALDSLLSELRERLRPGAPVVGLTYPDVWLGQPVREPGSASSTRIARASVVMFRDVVNPALRRTYAQHGARFADVTEEFGAYLPTDPTTAAGDVPARTALICTETYYCSLGDGHPDPRGHERIADLVLETFGSP